ncbi:MAG: hypothetical protein V4683_03820 [Bacteroidota bacterium]
MNKTFINWQVNRNKIGKLKILMFFLLSILNAFSQSENKYSIYISSQFGWTLNDYTQKNNFASIGIGAKIFQNNSSKFSPSLDFTIDNFASTLVGIRTSTGERPESIDFITNLLAGITYKTTPKGKISFVLGPSFTPNNTSLALKPSISIGKKIIWQIAYLQVFNREKITKTDFSSVNFIINFKIH